MIKEDMDIFYTVNPVLADTLRTIELQIISGEISSGDQLPCIRELAKIYGIGVTTAQKVIHQLQKENIVEKNKNVGFFVKPFVRGELINKHSNECKKLLKVAINYASEIGIDYQTIINEIITNEN